MGKHLKNKSTKGFTLIELVIAIAIIVVLAAVAVPSYLGHLRAAEFSPTVKIAEHLKIPVMNCIEKNKGLKLCHQNQYGIPPGSVSTSNKPGFTVKEGVIRAVAPLNAKHGVAGTTYTLTPHYTKGEPVTWTATGSACVKHYVDC